MPSIRETFEYRFIQSANRNTCISVGSKKIRLKRNGYRIVRRFFGILSESYQHESTGWLIRHRTAIRDIVDARPIAFLLYLINQAELPETLRLAIWLRGLCGGNLGSKSIAAHGDSELRQLRRTIILTLHKLHGWAELRNLQQVETDPELRQLAEPKSLGAYPERQNKFVRNVAQRSVTTKTTPFFASQEYGDQTRSGPKPAEYVRVLLMKISKAVNKWVGRQRPLKS